MRTRNYGDSILGPRAGVETILSFRCKGYQRKTMMNQVKRRKMIERDLISKNRKIRKNRKNYDKC